MKIMLQLFILIFFTLLGEAIAMILPFSISGSLIGLILLFLALWTKVLKVEHIKDLTCYLQKNMSFLFVPLCVGLIEYFDIVRTYFIEICVVLLVSTIVTLILTALTAKGGVKDE
ncbi:CidA/LrgA family protein [Acholeplasma equifetale]|uniref:CidA/LrgA family protein n=1 Tax=Acholeplasma equifetale TaxID=264634 RepID=UPI00047D054C|nr:CidA/LrgA family protein [Acholeplasma equifetale]